MPWGSNNTIELPFGTSLYDLKTSPMPPAEDMVQRDGLRLPTPAAALAGAGEYARVPL